MASIFANYLNQHTNTSVLGGSLFNSGFGSTSSPFFGGSGVGYTGGSSLYGGGYNGYSGYSSGFGGGYNAFGSSYYNPYSTFGSYNGIWGFGGTTTRQTTPTTTRETILTSVDTTEGSDFAFDAADFEYPDGTAVGGIYIVDVPENGTLELNGNEVDAGDSIDAADLDELDYVPNLNFDQLDSFVVRLSTDGETFDTTEYTIEVDVEGVNDAPKVSSISTVAMTEGATASNIGSLIINSVSDVDAGDSIGSVTITNFPSTSMGSLEYTSDAGGMIAITSNNTELTASEAASLQFFSTVDTVDGNTPEPVTIKFEVEDAQGTAGTTGGTVNIQIADGNDAPYFDGYDADVKVDENETDTGLQPNPASDEESPNTLV